MTTKSQVPITPFSSKRQELLNTMLKKKGIKAAEAAPIPRRDQASPCPLSYAQQRLWFLDQLHPASPAYNIPAAVRINGPLDIPALERSFNRVVRRHEVLRTVFSLHDGLPVQVVNPSAQLKLEVVDLTLLPDPERPLAANRLADRQASLGFDLSLGPLIRVLLLTEAPDRYLLLITLHHIVSDAWSMQVLVSEVVEGYRQQKDGLEDDRPEPEIQYGDYAVWERSWLEAGVMREAEDYWRRQLEGVSEVRLARGGKRQGGEVRRGGHERMEVSEEVSGKLREVSRREGVTLFMTMLAAFKILLHHYTDQTDIVVGTDEANRNRRELEGLIGFFINTLVLRTDVAGNPSFRELLKRVREVVLGAFSHKDVPFDYLVKVLKVKREAGVNPLFQIGFGLQNQKSLMPALSVAGLTLSSIEPGGESSANDTAIFDLSLNIYDRERDMVASFRYDRDLFEAPTISLMARHYQLLLESVAGQPDIRVDSLRALLGEWDSQQRMQGPEEFQRFRRNRLRDTRPKPQAR